MHSPEQEAVLNDSLKTIGQFGKYKLAQTGAVQGRLAKSVFKHGYFETNVNSAYSLELTTGKATMAVARFVYHVPRHRSSGWYTDFVFVGLTTLKKNYSHVYIREEGLKDKLLELFEPVEVDFNEDREFSNRYYVLSDNEMQLRSSVSLDFLNTIKKFPGLEIEIMGISLACRLKASISAETAGIICSFLTEVNNGQN